MTRFLMAILLLSVGLTGVVSAGGCGMTKDKHVITKDRQKEFGTANQPMPESARKGIAAMMAKRRNSGGTPPQPSPATP